MVVFTDGGYLVYYFEKNVIKHINTFLLRKTQLVKVGKWIGANKAYNFAVNNVGQKNIGFNILYKRKVKANKMYRRI